jgi:hypothetical protein
MRRADAAFFHATPIMGRTVKADQGSTQVKDHTAYHAHLKQKQADTRSAQG